MNDFEVTRSIALPDRFRIERCLRLPEFGPRILFFSGGSALRKTARVLKRYTHNSTHVITSFDSGGSSAELRRVFRMPSIGDLRNRLLALADESVQGNPEIYRLFSHRLSTEDPPEALAEQFAALLRGEDPLVADLPSSMASIVRTHLRAFSDHADGTGFDLRGASIGNLVLAAGYLENEKHLDSVLFLFSKLVGALGHVVPVTEECADLVADLAGGGRLVGQHRFGGASERIERISLITSPESSGPVSVKPSQKVFDAVRDADVVCLPMGSFYSSVVANLLPPGVADAVARSASPCVYVPNTGVDPEQGGRSVAECLEVLLSLLSLGSTPAPDDLGRGSGPFLSRTESPGQRRSVPGEPPIDFVFLDRSDDSYAVPPERERIAALGVKLVELELIDPDRPGTIDPVRLVEGLVSLA